MLCWTGEQLSKKSDVRGVSLFDEALLVSPLSEDVFVSLFVSLLVSLLLFSVLVLLGAGGMVGLGWVDGLLASIPTLQANGLKALESHFMQAVTPGTSAHNPLENSAKKLNYLTSLLSNRPFTTTLALSALV